MNEPVFTTREEALTAAERTFLPAGTEWTTNLLRDAWNAETELLTRFGALPTTLHFGSTEIDYRKGEVRFIDQDHRDGGDFLVHRAPLPLAWLLRLRGLER